MHLPSWALREASVFVFSSCTISSGPQKGSLPTQAFSGGAARPVGLSFSGTVLEDDPETGTLRVQTDCPGEGEISPTYTYADDRLTFYLPFMQMANGVALPVFERVE